MEGKWSDLWYIYITKGYEKTLAQMTTEEREARVLYDSVDSLEEFAKCGKKRLID